MFCLEMIVYFFEDCIWKRVWIQHFFSMVRNDVFTLKKSYLKREEKKWDSTRKKVTKRSCWKARLKLLQPYLVSASSTLNIQPKPGLLTERERFPILILDFIVDSCDKVSFSFIELEKSMLDEHVKSDNTLEMYESQRKRQFKSLQ